MCPVYSGTVSCHLFEFPCLVLPWIHEGYTSWLTLFWWGMRSREVMDLSIGVQLGTGGARMRRSPGLLLLCCKAGNLLVYRSQTQVGRLAWFPQLLCSLWNSVIKVKGTGSRGRLILTHYLIFIRPLESHLTSLNSVSSCLGKIMESSCWGVGESETWRTRART